MDREKFDKFKSIVYKFFREEKVSKEDMREFARVNFEYWATNYSNRKEHDFRKDLSEETLDDFREMWEGFVQKSIDFVKEHQDVQDVIAREKENVTKEWNPNAAEGDYMIFPDLRLHFGVDGLDESVKEGKWVSATDSGISISVGNKDIIEMM